MSTLLVDTIFVVALNDFATNFRLSYGLYIVELKHDESLQSACDCMRKAARFGLNLSGANTKTLAQDE